jgi:hypothetical protein
MKSPLIILVATLASTIDAHAQLATGSDREFAGMFVDNAQESIFWPCGENPDPNGWWVRFEPGVDAARARYQYSGPGFPTASHDIRVIGHLSPPGKFGTGFHTRELVISRLLEVTNPGGICADYPKKAAQWKGAGPVHLGVRSATPSEDQSIVAILDWLGEFSIWNTIDGEVTKRFPGGQTWRRDDGTSPPLAFSPNNDLLAAGGTDGFVRVWSIQNGRLRWRLRVSPNNNGYAPIGSVAFSPDGKILVAAGSGRMATWSMETGRLIDTLSRGVDNRSPLPGKAVYARRPARIIASGPDALLRAYGVEGGLPFLTAATGRAGSVAAISPNDQLLAMRGSNDSVFIWSLVEGKFTQAFTVPHFSWGSVAFSPDSKRIAIAGGGAFAVYIWDTATGQPLRRVRGLDRTPIDMWFTPDGDSIVVSASFDTTLSVLPIGR